jgi:ABC-type Na+ efflux pump permease subunit
MPIYDQTFRRYEGLRSTSGLWFSVARQTLRPFWKAKFNYLLMSGFLIPVLVLSVAFFASAKIQTLGTEQVEAAARVAEVSDFPLFGRNLNINTVVFRYLTFCSALLWITVLANGGGSISGDKRNGALPLYFSRPLSVRDYLVGKIVGLAVFPALLLAVSIVLVYVQAWAYFFSFAQAMASAYVVFGALAYVVAFSLLASLSMAAFSSMAKSARAAGVMFIGFWFVSSAAGDLLRHATHKAFFAAVSPGRSLFVMLVRLLKPDVRRLMRDPDFVQFHLGIAFASVLVYTLLFLWLLRRNVKVVEVVR